MIRVIYSNGNGKTTLDLPVERIQELLATRSGTLWIDICEEEMAVAEPILRDIFGFHPLAISDALEETHVPRVDDWGTYLYIVLHALAFDQDQDEPLRTNEVDIFLGKNYLVTYQTRKLEVIDRVWDMVQRDVHFLQKGADHLFYKLADDLIADYLPLVDQMDVVMDEIEDQVFNRPSQNLLERIFLMKRSLMHLRRTLAPLREVFNKLARGDDQVIDKSDRIFFRDIYDHLVRLYDISESLRDLMGSVLDTYLSAINNRMNEVMKTLTIITTLFMPLSFLVGFFGMNFFIPKEPITSWVNRPVFLFVLAAIITLPLIMFWWMRRRKWM